MTRTRPRTPLRPLSVPPHTPVPLPARPPGLAGVLLLLALTVGTHDGLAAEPAAATPLPPAAVGPVDFEKQIQPLLKAACIQCHGPEKQKAGFRLDDRAAALRGGDNHSPAIVPGDSANSALVRIVAGTDPELVMPPSDKGKRFTPEEVGLLRAWIDQGAPWGAGGEPGTTAATPEHWAFRPLQAPALPGIAEPAANPIDAFIQAGLSPKGLELSPEADRITLVRRLWLVMLGVPPAPEEVDAFLQDRRTDAYARLVDKVLDDPRYGERWGRHWLDVVRFAESNGFETNRERTSAWRFRDYVIAAFNSDKPYDRFIREQIAGDTLGAEVATGFLVGGPVDIVGSPDPVLTAQQRADELDDMVSTTSTAFLGLTLGCARCHSHKFDPVSQKEYYGFAALFAGVKHGERPLPMPAAQSEKVTQLDARIAELENHLKRFIPTNAVASKSLRPPVAPGGNEETFPPTSARWIRFSIQATTGGEPCLDELEVWAGGKNVALAANGAKVSASGTLPGYEIHKLEHLIDGKPGNDHSWISNEAGRGWVQVELPAVTRIDRITWARDRTGQFKDRLASQYQIEASVEPGAWVPLTGSNDRQPLDAKIASGSPYRFEGVSEPDAAQGRLWLSALESTRKERSAAAKPPTAYAGTFIKPGETHRLHRGDPMQKREPVPPATLAVFKPIELASDEPEQNRRRKLADWIADPGNPLTPRVIVNRVWQYQFGVGLVDTPNDFGKNGARPSHPELLEWLAADFIAHGWSIKHLQRRILLSSTWRQSGKPRAEGIKVDAGSRLLWRFPPRRIEAEGIRDGMLAVSGELVHAGGGPSFFLHQVDRENVYHYHPKEEFGPAESRRMVYAFKVRMEQDGIFGAFDCPDGSLVMPRRSLSTTPLQALNLFNSRFALDQAGHFARRLEREAGPDPENQIRRAWKLAFSREPSRAEVTEARAFAKRQGTPALCRALLNSNEFLFIP